jgi:hypothetical protein
MCFTLLSGQQDKEDIQADEECKDSRLQRMNRSDKVFSSSFKHEAAFL